MVEFLLALIITLAELQSSMSGGNLPKLTAPSWVDTPLSPLVAIATVVPRMIPPTTQAPMATLPPARTPTPTAKPLPTNTPVPLSTPTPARKVVNGKVYDAYI